MKLFLSLFFLSLNSYGFTLAYSNEARFPVTEVTFNVAGNSCSTAGVSVNELLDLAEEAMDKFWNRVPTCKLELKRGGITGADVSADTGVASALDKVEANSILIGCNSGISQFSGSVAGVATIDPNGDQNRGIVLINNTNSTFADLSKDDKLAVLAHEVGHAIGLGHTSDEAALMYYAIGGKIQDQMSIDDYDGCSYLYPHDSAPGSCSSVGIVPPNIDKDQDKGLKNSYFISLLLGLILVISLPKRRRVFVR